MTNFTRPIKQILEGLSYQYVSNNLSLSDKVSTLKHVEFKGRQEPNVVQMPVDNFGHVALLCNGCSGSKTVNYLIDHARDSTIDILCHGHKKGISCECYQNARQRLVENNIDVRLWDFINASYSDIKSFLLEQTGFKFLVADYNDTVLKNFLKQNHVNYPIVLIDG